MMMHSHGHWKFLCYCCLPLGAPATMLVFESLNKLAMATNDSKA